MAPRYAGAPRRVTIWWSAAVIAAIGYGIFLAVTALRVRTGADLTGQFGAQPGVKSLMALLLAVAALSHPVARERRWLLGATLFSAAGDFLLALPELRPAFVCGLASFLVAHLCFIGALLPLRGHVGAVRRLAVVLIAVGFVVMLIWYWPALTAEGMTVPVIVYMTVLGLMVTTALLAQLPTIWTAVGALLFAVSDGMIGIGRFVLRSQALELPIWWVYAASMLLITAGFFFGRRSG